MNSVYPIMKHPNEDSINRFAAGECDVTERLMIEAHTHFCTSCRDQAYNQRETLRVVGSESDFLKSDSELFEKILQRVDEQVEYEDLSDLGIPKHMWRDIPRRGVWKWFSFWPSKGKVALLATDYAGPYQLFVGILESSKISPSHSHRHNEQTLTLKGQYVNRSEVFNVGEWSEMTPGDEHSPMAGPMERCVCLIRSHKRGFRFTRLASWRNVFNIFL